MAELNKTTGSETGLSMIEQAAIVLLSMGEEPAAAVLRCLSREELLEVTQVMSRMSGIKVEAVKTAMQNFFDDYRQQSGVHGASRSYLKRSLDLAREAAQHRGGGLLAHAQEDDRGLLHEAEARGGGGRRNEVVGLVRISHASSAPIA